MSEKGTIVVKNKLVKELYDNVGGNQKSIHKLLCDMSGKKYGEVNISSLYSRVKSTVENIKRLKNGRNEEKFNTYNNSEFQFPQLSKKRKLDIKLPTDNAKQLRLEQQLYDVTIKEKGRNSLISKLNQKIKRYQQTIVRLQGVNRKQRQELKRKKNPNCTEEGIQCNIMAKVVNDLNDEIDNLRDQIDENNNVENDLECERMLNTRQQTKGKPYNAKLRSVYYFMRSRQIGIEHIAPVIKSVLTLVDIEVSDLPSTTTALNFTSEIEYICKEHIVEKFNEVNNITLHRDATTKKGRHFYGMQISDGESNFTLGLKEVPNGKADTYVNTTKEVFTDLNLGDDIKGDKILSRVTNFMTDRSSTEEKVNKILNDTISEGTGTSPNSFKCAVHPLLQFSQVCEKEVKDIEKELSLTDDTGSKESIVHSLLRCVSKLFYKDGSGDPLLSIVYLKSVGISSLPIKNFRGNRFNIFFHNAAGTYFLAKHLTTFLENSKATLNFNQHYIYTYIRNPYVLAICRALGIISKLINEPYWDAAANDSKSAVDMGNVYIRLIEVLKICMEDPKLLLLNHIKLFAGPSKVLDDISSILYESCDLDEKTVTCLKRFCVVLVEKSQKLFKDFLPGGQFYNPSDQLINSSQTCAPNNISVERLMAKLDSTLHKAPTINTSSMETIIKYRNNNTHDWLENKNDEEQHKIIANAMKQKKEIERNNKVRSKKLYEQRLQILKDRSELKKRIETRKQQQKLAIQNLIKEKGIWECENKIDIELNKLKTKKEKIQQLKHQITIYKDEQVLKMKPADKHLLNFSSKGKQFDIPKLKTNLVKLIELRQVSEIDGDPNQIQLLQQPESIVNRTIVHTWSDAEGGDETKWNGRIMSYSNGIFQIKYWEAIEDKEENETFDLTIEEITVDMEAGNFCFIDHTN